MQAGRIRDAVQDAVGGTAEELVGLSRRIHAHPEVAFEEERASAWVAGMLADAGWDDVERGGWDLPTSVRASIGPGPLHVAVCAEYDALPGVGHACGHNVIAAAAVGAGLALAGVAEELGLRVTVLGTPAEEAGGGKILMLERGAFDGVHAAMMVHPAPHERPAMATTAVHHFEVRYEGVEAHAAAYPELGVNAADALVVAQVAVGLLRQHLRPTDLVHGIVTRGGEAANVVPGLATGEFMVRARDLAELAEVRTRVWRCFEAGALATGADLRITPEPAPYAELRSDPGLLAAYVDAAGRLGRVFAPEEPGPPRGAGSTDMGNVSHVVPSIHPTLDVGAGPAVNHQPAFAAACAAPAADRAVLDGAVAMAWTAVAAATDPALRARLLAGR